MKLPKYVRIQGRELAWKTKKPVEIFILNWRRIRDNIYSPEDVKLYNETHQWFLEHLPEPPFYGDDNDNPQGAITWFKTDACGKMLGKITPLVDLLDKYNIPYDDALVMDMAGSLEMQAAYDSTTELLNSGAEFTALFTTSDTNAIAAIKAIQDSGKEVPRDVSVIAIDGLDVSKYLTPTLTTMVQPAEEMGCKSVEILLDILEGRGKSRRICVEATIREGASVRPL